MSDFYLILKISREKRFNVYLCSYLYSVLFLQQKNGAESRC